MTASKDAVNARQLKILKMDTLHLNHYLNEMMLENPVIEIEENLTGYTDEDMRARKAEWLESNDFEEGLGYFDKETELPEAEDPDYALLNMHEGKTLEQHLYSQISVQQLDERVRAAAVAFGDRRAQREQVIPAVHQIELRGRTLIGPLPLENDLRSLVGRALLGGDENHAVRCA